MTNQEAFTKMVQHLRKQGRKSESANGENCLYRGPGGLMCAIGALITDEEYQEEWDQAGTRVGELDRCPSLDGLDVTMLERMQYAHDIGSVMSWEAYFERIAKSYGLIVPPIDEKVPA